MSADTQATSPQHSSPISLTGRLVSTLWFSVFQKKGHDSFLSQPMKGLCG